MRLHVSRPRTIGSAWTTASAGVCVRIHASACCSAGVTTTVQWKPGPIDRFSTSCALYTSMTVVGSPAANTRTTMATAHVLRPRFQSRTRPSATSGGTSTKNRCPPRNPTPGTVGRQRHQVHQQHAEDDAGDGRPRHVQSVTPRRPEADRDRDEQRAERQEKGDERRMASRPEDAVVQRADGAARDAVQQAPSERREHRDRREAVPEDIRAGLRGRVRNR